LFVANVYFNAGTGSYAVISITTLLSVEKDFSNIFIMSGSGDPALNLTRVFKSSTTQTFNLIAQAGNITTVSNINFTAVRIG